MDDQAMIDAGVNTIGARRKLLKVFENVQRHCEDNVSKSEREVGRGVSKKGVGLDGKALMVTLALYQTTN
jgi:hypothetical protein